MTDPKQRELLGRMLRDELTRNASSVPDDRDEAELRRERRKELQGVLPQAEIFRDVAKEIATHAPPFDFVVLLANKMPRLMDALELDFSGQSQALVVSDLALPWIANRLAGTKIAVIDDSINVGSTLYNVMEFRLKPCRPGEVKWFARFFKEGPKPNKYGFDGEIKAKKHTLSENEYSELASRIALRLALLNKPYELEFPVLTFSYAPGIASVKEMFDRLREGFGETNLYSLEHPVLAGAGLYRFAVSVPEKGKPGDQQIKLYVDDMARECRLVPMCVPGRGGQGEELTGDICRVMDDMRGRLAPGGAPSVEGGTTHLGETFAGEAAARMDIFANSLAFGLRMLNSFSKVLAISQDSGPILARRDTSLLFGAPELGEAWEALAEQTVPAHLMK